MLITKAAAKGNGVMNTALDLPAILKKHSLWLGGSEGGERADLSEADLSEANLSGANLSGADLYRANLYRANLSGAKGVIQGATRSDGYAFIGQIVDGVLKIKAGCRYFDIDIARAHWANTRGGTSLGEETTSILDNIERLARIRGMILGAV